MAKIEIEVPNKIVDASFVESIRTFIKYEIPKWEVSVRGVKKGPSLKFKSRERLGEWKAID